jgi:hypothetical protein
MSALSSPRRFCVVGTSKKPPQMRELPGDGGDVGLNRFKHGGGEYRMQNPESRRENGFDVNYPN